VCRYVPGQEGVAKVILALRKGWKGLRQFPVFPDRAALVVSAGLLLPYSSPDFASSLSKVPLPRPASATACSLTCGFRAVLRWKAPLHAVFCQDPLIGTASMAPGLQS